MTHDTCANDPAAATVAGQREALYRYARRLERNPVDAEDLVQETLSRGLQAARSGRIPADMRAYLFSTMHNLRVDRLRRAAPAILLPTEEDEPAVPASQEGVLYCAEVLDEVDKLNEVHKTVLLCVARDGLTTREAANQLGVPEGTVLSRLSRARAELRTRLAVA